MARIRISAASLAGDSQSPLGFFGSLALHGLIIAAMFFTFSHRLDIVDESTPVVPVDLVTLAAKTNVRAMVKEQPKVAPEVKPVPTPPQPTPQPEENETPPPDQAASEPVIEKPPPLPVPQAKPQQPPKEDKKKDLSKLLAALTSAPDTPAHSNQHAGPRTTRGLGEQNAMTAELSAMLASEIARCYHPPAGVPNPGDLIADFDVIFSRDGNVSQPPQLVSSASNSYARAGADAARRAIYECAPYNLPQDRYADWREINPFHFDPRGFLGDGN